MLIAFLIGVLFGSLTTYLACRNNPKVVAKLNADLNDAQSDLSALKAKAAQLGVKL